MKVSRWDSLETRFWAAVDKRGADECWPWMGTTIRGYGSIRMNGKTARAPRVAWLLAGRTLDPNLVIDHLCRNPSCVNVAHLELVTSRENTMRGNGPAVRNLAKVACPRGHPYSGRNLYVRSSGGRDCRRCNADRMARKKPNAKVKQLAIWERVA